MANRVIKMTLTYETTIDLEDPKDVKFNEDLLKMFLDAYNEDNEEARVESLRDADSTVLHDIIRYLLEDDFDSVLAHEDILDSNNVRIEVFS